MIRSIFRKFLLLTFCFSTISLTSVNAFLDFRALFDFKKYTEADDIGYELLSGIKARKDQLKGLKQELVKLTKANGEQEKAAVKKISEIEVSLGQISALHRKTIDAKEKEYLKSRTDVLKEQKQVLANIKESLKEQINVLASHIKLVESIIELISTGTKTTTDKILYTLKEYNDVLADVRNISNKISRAKGARQTLLNQRKDFVTTLESLKTSLEKKATEEKTFDEQKAAVAKEGGEAEQDLRRKIILLNDERLLLQEKSNLAKAQIKHVSFEIKKKINEVQLLEYQSESLNKQLPEIKNKLDLRVSDVLQAKDAFKGARHSGRKAAEDLDKARRSVKTQKGPLGQDLTSLKEELKLRRKTEAEESAEYFVTESKISKTENLIASLNEKLRLLEAQRKFEDVKIERKKQEYEIIEIRYDIAREMGNVNEWIKDFKHQQEAAVDAIKLLQDQQSEVLRLLPEKTRAKDLISRKKTEITGKKILFKGKARAYSEVITHLDSATHSLESLQQYNQQYQAINSQLINIYRELIDQSTIIIAELETHKVTLSIWKRSPRAISYKGFIQSILDAERFVKQFFWETPSHIGPFTLFRMVRTLSVWDYVGFALFAFLFFLLFFFFRNGFLYLRKRIVSLLATTHKRIVSMYLNSLLVLVEFLIRHFSLIFSWTFLLFFFQLGIDYQSGLLRYFSAPYFHAIFYFASIPTLVYISRQLLMSLKILNQKLSFLFFTEKLQEKFILLITVFLYASSILIPVRQAFLHYITYPTGVVSDFPSVILAAYTLILVIVVLFFFNKDDVLRLIPSTNMLLLWMKKKIDKYYYPVFTFCMGLLILSNPYIGYSNLAWYLAFAVPSTMLIVYGLFLAHYYIRRYSAFFFITEEDDEVIDKFEHARTYYGFFIVFAFVFMLLGTFIISARIWGFEYTLASVWHSLSQEWVLRDVLVPGSKLGLVEFLSLIGFIAVGVAISSLLNKFVLTKLFDIFRTEPGAQNTITRILHYIIIFLATIFGLTAINLGKIVGLGSALFALGIGFGLNDLVKDFFAGFWVLIERPVEIGQFIQTGELLGTVHKIAARATTIRTARNFHVVIPNRELITRPIINWSAGRYAVGLEIKILVNYGADPVHVAKILRETAQEHPFVLRVPNIVVRLDEFAENGMLYLLRAFISSRRVRDQWDIASDIRSKILEQFKANGISIPYPHRIIHQAGTTGEITGAHSYYVPEPADEFVENGSSDDQQESAQKKP